MKDYYKVGFEKYIQMAINALKASDYGEAEKRIKQAMLIKPHSANVHNLYGILEECLKDNNLANKHYRAACALDPTYRPSIRNLERITSFYAYNSRRKFDFGDKPEEEEHERIYEIVYDNHNVGHLCK
jgi:tetratricopeptide (TPR) repeat protein